MFLSVATTHQPATDLGYLLRKHPAKVHDLELAFGRAILFYPEATPERCEAALVLDVDPIALVRGRGGSDGPLDQYVNDRPYAASSFLSVAIGRMLRTAMTGTAAERPELAEAAIPLEAVVTPLPVRGGGEALVRSLFEPLGWTVGVEPVPAAAPGATGSRYVTLRLAGTARLQALLNHLYVLIPVLDDDKHYWVDEEEVAKLLRRGEGWLEGHPERDLIVRRYLTHRRSLTRVALERLAPEAREETADPADRTTREQHLEKPLRLNDERLTAVVEALRAAGARTIADLGCGEGNLLQRLARERWVERAIGVDAAARDLEWAARRLKLDHAGGPAADRIQLLHGSVTYRDRRWEDVDAAALVEVIEHLEPDRLPALEGVVFGAARPKTVVVTTPNADYNALFPNLAAGAFRHPDHRFEWSRAEFRAWAGRIAETRGYTVAYSDVGRVDPDLGAPTQMAVFTREAA